MFFEAALTFLKMAEALPFPIIRASKVDQCCEL